MSGAVLTPDLGGSPEAPARSRLQSLFCQAENLLLVIPLALMLLLGVGDSPAKVVSYRHLGFQRH